MYAIKCDECKTELGQTVSLRESAAGWMCLECRTARLERGAVEIVRGNVINRYFYSQPDTLGRRSYIDHNPTEGMGRGSSVSRWHFQAGSPSGGPY